VRDALLKSWVVLGLLFLGHLLNYYDRQALSVLKSTLGTEFGITNVQYSWLITAFMAPYVVMYLISGRLVDKYGSRIMLSLFIAVWSAATLLMGLVNGLVGLLLCRVLLGMAEPGVFPATQSVLVKWFPAHQRGFASSLVAPASILGAVIAPPLIAFLASHYNWRLSFILPGVLGLMLAAVWWRTDRGEPYPVVDGRGAKLPAIPLRVLLRSRNMWAIILTRVLTDPVWYFLMFWLPAYLQDHRKLTLTQLGHVGWIPPLVASVLAVAIAKVTDQMIAGGRDPVVIRRRALLLITLMTPLGIIVAVTPNIALVIICVSIVYSVAKCWFLYMGVISTDLFPRNAVASVMGIAGACGAGAGLLSNSVTGWFIDQFGYGPLFVMMGLMHPIALFIFLGLSQKSIGSAREFASGEPS
jgi:ACS family hexuronate transporter-like MFS transporter